ncbi:DUF3396 domain-containing protein [Corallococcus terminator]
MTEHYPRIRRRARNGALLLREGLSVCLYIPGGHLDLRQRVLLAMKHFVEAVGPEALEMYASTEGEWCPLDSAGWDHVRAVLLQASCPMIQLRSRSPEDGYGFDFLGKPEDPTPFTRSRDVMNAIRFMLPTEFLDAHGPESMRKLALDLATNLPFSSGHAGLAFDGEFDIVGVAPEVRALCFRYPGLDLLSLIHVSWDIGTRVRGPAWLTFLGQPALEGLGGVSRLREQLRAPDTTVDALPEDRAVITLGPWPEAGDTNLGNTLPHYRELARVLEPWLFREQHPYSQGLSEDELLRWERRFLD